MWNVQSLEGANYEMCKIQNVFIMDCAKKGICRVRMYTIWNVQNMECAEQGMSKIQKLKMCMKQNVHNFEYVKNGISSILYM